MAVRKALPLRALSHRREGLLPGTATAVRPRQGSAAEPCRRRTIGARKRARHVPPTPCAPSPLHYRLLVPPEPSRVRSVGSTREGLGWGPLPLSAREAPGRWGQAGRLENREGGKMDRGSRSRRVDKVGVEICVGPNTWIISRTGFGCCSAQR
jgi:hypothetical protein